MILTLHLLLVNHIEFLKLTYTVTEGTKFGASYNECLELISKCKELNVNLVGLSFHVGSGYVPRDQRWFALIN